jgi:arylsulfatase A-like enzyme
MEARLDRRAFLGALGLGAGAAALGRLAIAQAPRRPNILVLVADDLGYADLGVQGCTDIPTPNVDGIARAGVRFTQGYVSAPLCSPTRAGIQTGRYQQRFGHETNPGPAQSAAPGIGLPLTETTLADRLREAGYATGLVGKWHLGYDAAHHPMRRGYQEFFGFLGGAHPYLPDSAKSADPILRGTEPVEEKEYLTDAFAREAADYVRRHKADPFYLMVTFNAIHMPAEATEQYLSRFTGIQDPIRRNCAARLSAMDDAIGRVLGEVREAGLEDDTLVLLVSDNGGPTPTNGSRNTPLRGYKAQMLEGGIRVPYLVQWKKRLPQGIVEDRPVISLDIHPTCLAAAGWQGTVPAERALDGVDLAPYLDGTRSERPHEVLTWRMEPQAAIRKGDLKLVRTRDEVGLYDLASDPGETKDLRATRPDDYEDLHRTFLAWDEQLAEPLWGGTGQKQQRRRRAVGRAG